MFTQLYPTHKQFYELWELLAYVAQTTGGDPKGICELGEVPFGLGERIRQQTGLDTHKLQLTLDSYGIRHAFGGHSQERGSRDQYPLPSAADVPALPGWLFAPSGVLPGVARAAGLPQRLELAHLDRQTQVKTVVILEVRPTMYKTQNG